MISNRLYLFIIILLTLPISLSTVTAADVASIADMASTRYETAVSEQQEQTRTITRARQKLVQRIETLTNKTITEETLLKEEKEALQRLAEKRDALQHEIATRLASKEELDNIFLDHIRNFLGLSEKTPYSNQQPTRLETLNRYLTGNRIFNLEDMETLLAMYFDDISAGTENTRYQGPVLNRSGEERAVAIIRIGHMGALFETADHHGFLTFSPASKRLLMSGAPGFFIQRSLASFFKGKTTETPIDITGGIAISQLSQKETLEDRLRSGGVLVIPILLVGLAAIVLAIERLIFLSRVRSNTDALMTTVTKLVLDGKFEKALETTKPHHKRPTGRVLMSGLNHRNDTREVIESAISEAILTQTPRLERFIGTLKVLAAVAPLLGLLGTVTGMINTFQVITTYGTGDPRLMAGGISEAMVTTQVGLAVAIPIMMTASFLGGRVRNLSRDMEEKGIALMSALLRRKTVKV